LLEAFGIDTSRVTPFAPPYCSSISKQKAQQFFDSLSEFDKHGLKIGLNLSAGSESRAWALTNYQALTDRIGLAFPQASIILFTIPSERQRAMELRALAKSKVSIIPDNLELPDVCAIIKHLDVLISPDTSLVHIARSFQVSVVGLYTRFMKNYLLWKPFGQESGSVISGNDYNIHDISAEQVFETLIKMTEMAQKVKS
jgi:ADP-heptose:LPS heptosyltransferase